MIAHRCPRFAMPLGLLAVVACSDDSSVTQPSAAGPEPSGPAFAWAPNSWLAKAKLPNLRWAAGAAVAKDASGKSLLFVIGGYAPTPQQGDETETVVAYDPAANTWSSKAPLPLSLAHPDGVGVINNKLYVTAGWQEVQGDNVDGLRTLFVYDPVKNTWARRANFPYKSAEGASGVIGGKLYVLAGGCDCPDGAGGSQLFFRYDPATNVWTALPSAPAVHASAAAGVINGKFYVAGGYSSQGVTRRLDVYDPVTNKWTTRAQLPASHLWPASAVLGGKLYVMGGRGSDGAVYAYNPATNNWTQKASMGSEREQLAAAMLPTPVGNRIFAVGGWQSDVVEAYKQ